MTDKPFYISGHRIYNGPVSLKDLHLLRSPGIVYHNQDFSREELRSATLEKTTFVNCTLREANLRWAKITDAAFINCDLTGVHAFGAVFTTTRFMDSVLDNAHLHRARFFESDLGENIAAAEICGAGISVGTDLPPGLIAALPSKDSKDSLANTAPVVVDYDLDYLSSFASRAVVEVLINEHYTLPLAHLITLLRALSPVAP